jgi:myo-inositol-1-phosphate synthase
MTQARTGLWIVGAFGGVATTTILGLIALRKGLIDQCGLASELPQFEPLGLLGWDDWVIGGHDIRRSSLASEARKLARTSRAFDESLVEACRAELEQIDQSIRMGVLWNVGPTIRTLADAECQAKVEHPWESIGRLQQDLHEFRTANRLDRVIVVNLASTEPPVDAAKLPAAWAGMARLLRDNAETTLPASTFYAIAALDLGLPYINFTPSLGSTPPAVCQLAEQRGTCHMGQDGKTGETLLKSVLAPMFAHRNLQVMSWVGHNIFGNLDGKVLNDPTNKQSKVVSKDNVLRHALGYSPQTLVSIEYIESLGDWKTAWDHIHFRGFLGTPMVMQFTWQGCDSVLAAPLVLDLARFVERAHRAGETGLLTFLAPFFKSPIGVDEHNFERQFQMLESWVERTSQAQKSP